MPGKQKRVTDEQHGTETVLVHAPYGKDAAIICQVLQRAEIGASICCTTEELCARLGEATALSKFKLELLKPLGNVALLERPLRSATLVSALRSALRARERQYQLRENFAERERLVLELKRSNDELASFAHIVSHDLQAPIRMVNAFSALLAKRYAGKLDQDADGYIQAIQKGASAMDELVRTLLHYATAGQDAMMREEIDLNALVRDVLHTLQPSIEEAEAEVTCGDLEIVFGDRLLLRQVIQNLVGNALKYCQPGGGTSIRIFSERSGNEDRVFVQDNGPGIDAAYHERIFQPLKRLHGHEIPGTGMGLAVCRKIIERHGGRIWVQSAPGLGATFIFAIPIRAHEEITLQAHAG